METGTSRGEGRERETKSNTLMAYVKLSKICHDKQPVKIKDSIFILDFILHETNET